MYDAYFESFIARLSINNYETIVENNCRDTQTFKCIYCISPLVCMVRKYNISNNEYPGIMSVFISCPILYNMFLYCLSEN